jgi:hypothetical protein
LSRCPAPAWRRFIDEARAELARRQRPATAPAKPRVAPRRDSARAILHPTTELFLRGNVAPGGRNDALYAAVCNMLGVGFDPKEAARLALDGARLCGLAEGEALATIASAMHRKKRACA